MELLLRNLDLYFGQPRKPVRKIDNKFRFNLPMEYISVIETRNHYLLREILTSLSIESNYVVYKGQIAFRIDRGEHTEYEQLLKSPENIGLSNVIRTLHFEKNTEGKELKVYTALDWIINGERNNDNYEEVIDKTKRVLLPEHARFVISPGKKVIFEPSEDKKYFTIRPYD